MIDKISFTEVMITSVITACAYLRKEQVKDIFTECGETPKDMLMENNEDYLEGELQFNFDKDTKELTEILVFPVYASIEGLANGDFINAPDYIWEKFGLEAKNFAFDKESNGKNESFELKAFRYIPHEGGQANYLAVVPMNIHIAPGRQYKDGTRQWLVYGGPLNATSKETATLFTMRGTKEDAEKELVKYLEAAQERASRIIQNFHSKQI